MKYLLTTLTILIFMMCIGACQKADDRPLTEEEKDLVDTIYFRSIDSVRSAIDSICAARHDEMFDKAADSIMKLRIEEIRELMSTQ